MPADIRTRLAEGVTFQARIGDREIELAEEHLKALGGVLNGKIPGFAGELRQLFDFGILELGEMRQPTEDEILAQLPGKGNAAVFLDPRVQVTVTLIGEGIEEPLEASHVYSHFISPALAVALAELAKDLKAAGEAMRRNELTRDQALHEADWLRTIEAIYRQHCGQKPLSDFMRIVDDPASRFRLEILQPLQAADCRYPEARLSIQRTDLPETMGTTALIASHALPAAGRFIRELGEGIGRFDLARDMAASQDGAHLLTCIAALTRGKALALARQEAGARECALPRDNLLGAVHLGHAGLCIGGGAATILVDPWFLPAHPDYRQQPPQAAELPPIEAIFLTHEHWDHVNAETMLRYPSDVPIVVPRQDPASPLYPRYREYLGLFGCDRVIELGHWERVDLAEGLTVTAIPFRGEGTLEHGAPRNCYLIERGGRSIFVHVDSSPDSLGQSDLTDGTIARLVAEHGAVDVVYATRRQELHFAWEVISDLYPVFLGADPRRILQVIENCNCTAAYLADLAQATSCSMLVLYSEGGAEWFPDDSNFLRSDRSEGFRGEDHLWDSLEEIAAAVPVPVRMSRPYDSVSLNGNGSTFIEGPVRT